jgi:hypothetical protein
MSRSWQTLTFFESMWTRLWFYVSDRSENYKSCEGGQLGCEGNGLNGVPLAQLELAIRFASLS